MKTGSAKVIRCAIYTRVSTDHGLEQDFNSLDAQYDASQAYTRLTLEGRRGSKAIGKSS
jgi:site-specific DNA recombinase